MSRILWGTHVWGPTRRCCVEEGLLFYIVTILNGCPFFGNMTVLVITLKHVWEKHRTHFLVRPEGEHPHFLKEKHPGNPFLLFSVFLNTTLCFRACVCGSITLTTLIAPIAHTAQRLGVITNISLTERLQFLRKNALWNNKYISQRDYNSLGRMG